MIDRISEIIKKHNDREMYRDFVFKSTTERQVNIILSEQSH